MRLRLAAMAAIVISVLVAPEARAELVDLRGPVRIGTGWSHLYHERVLSLSFEDAIALWRLGDHARGEILFGMDGVRGPTYTPPGKDPTHDGYLAANLGLGLSFPLAGKDDGPLLAVNATMGPLFEGKEDFAPHGIGVAARAEVFPLYLGLESCVACDHGWFRTYVLSGLSGWALARQDWLGSSSGPTFAAGFAVDFARNLLLPLLGSILGGACSSPHEDDPPYAQDPQKRY